VTSVRGERLRRASLDWQSGLTTEVSSRHRIVAEQSFRRTLHGQPAGLQDVAVVGNFQGGQCILFDELYGDALLADPLDGLEDQVDEHRCQSHGRFVEQQEGWISQERSRHSQHLLFATR
jgi:hypothetical protein